jgi:hypothetical protein
MKFFSGEVVKRSVVTALPPDVRKGFAFPAVQLVSSEAAPQNFEA